ncbi:hypothetical protein NEH50_19155, partial [Xanthomonas hortorum pv. pelargonii]|nr:hypothetical protein [Xanthomonas hortorum pv. pelargonii]MCM5576143.1 hypothetical protein [Xanthomonas hortorum pv. pelargonii]
RWAGKGPAANPQISRPAAKTQIIRSATDRHEVIFSAAPTHQFDIIDSSVHLRHQRLSHTVLS